MSLALLALLAMRGAAQAPAPMPQVWPMAAPVDLASRTREAAAVHHVSGEAADLACRLVAEGLSLCFVKGDGSELDYVTRADLGVWGMDLPGLEAMAGAAAQVGLEGGRPSASAVDGMAGTYWFTAEADGKDAAGLLFPDRLQQIAGQPVVVAVPAQGALLFWVPGNPEFDQVMAVGVRRLYDSAEQRVSSKIYGWDGAKWIVWGEAVPAGAADPLLRR